MQPAILKPPPEGGVALLSDDSYEVAIYAAPDPTRSQPSQDRALASLDHGHVLLAVADGAGGHANGGRAATITVDALEEAASVAHGDREIRFAVLDALERANREILALGDGAATTLASALVIDSRVRTFHVGDAMVLVIGGRGRVRLVTAPHSPVGYAIEAGVIEPEEAMHHEDRHLVSNVVGDEDMRVEIRTPMRLMPRDTVVVGSDGLYDNMHTDEIADCLKQRRLADAAEALAASCHRRMLSPIGGEPSKPDDLAFVLLRRHREKSRKVAGEDSQDKD